jgi:hypothetical protein
MKGVGFLLLFALIGTGGAYIIVPLLLQLISDGAASAR